MRIIRPLLVALCLALVVVSVATPASAQRTPRPPRTPGGDFPTQQPPPPAQPVQPTQRPPAPATPPLPTRAGTVTSPSPTIAPTPTEDPTPEPTVAPSPTEAPAATTGNRFGLGPVLFIVGLVLVTLLIILVGRRRTEEPGEGPPPPLVVGPSPAISPTPESAATQAEVTEAATASGNTIVCENCGRASPAEYHFCDGCGRPLKKPEA